MNLIRFTFANIFDYLVILENAMNPDYKNEYGPFNLSNNIHESNLDKLQITFEWTSYKGPYEHFVKSFCAPTNIEDLYE